MRLPRSLILTPLLVLGTGCAPETDAPEAAETGSFPPLPLALSNNAVALARVDGAPRLYSFFGLGAGKTWLDIGRHAFEYDFGRGAWAELPPVPVSEGRLASIAAAAGDAIYLFGGYTVAPGGHEVSTPEVFRFDPAARRYAAVAPMPTPVDDSVALVRRDRWIYLVSGWHMNANVDRVQVYDSRTDTWSQATAYPGAPVFGHAGAILGDVLVVCDGVRLDVVEGKRRFSASDQCWRGRIDPAGPTRIAWQRTPPHPGPPRYRMGAAADSARGRLIFAGGSENPYNYDGIGYDGRPSPASARVHAYDPAADRWQELPPLPAPSMDHRGMPGLEGPRSDRTFYLIGGMRDAQRVSAQVTVYRP